MNPPRHLAPRLGMTPLEFCRDIWHPKTRVPGLSYDVLCVIPRMFSRFGTIPVCDRRTDRQTDRQADTRLQHTRASIASCGSGNNLISSCICYKMSDFILKSYEQKSGMFSCVTRQSSVFLFTAS